MLLHGLVVSRGTDGSNRWRVTSSGHMGETEERGVGDVGCVCVCACVRRRGGGVEDSGQREIGEDRQSCSLLFASNVEGRDVMGRGREREKKRERSGCSREKWRRRGEGELKENKKNNRETEEEIKGERDSRR